MAKTSGIATLDQRRAKHAWQVIERVMVLDKVKRKEFGTQAKKLPTRIMAAGLGQALAFLVAKNSERSLVDALSDWIQQRRGDPSKPELLKRIIQGDADFLRFATAESLAYLQWLVRFADANDLTD